MENSFKSVVDKSKSILVLLPLQATLDHVASGLSLYLALRGEKDIQIYSPQPMIVEFNRLVGINKISQELGNKNLIIEFSDYKATDIERVSYDIKDGQFKLTVIPKLRVSPPIRENVSLSYSGISSDLVVMIGGDDTSKFPSIVNKDFDDAILAHVGINSIKSSLSKDLISFSKPCSSVSELVTGLLRENDLKIDEDIATNLLMGIEKETESLSSTSVTADTFYVISELMRLGGKRPVKIQPPAFISNSTPRSFQNNQTIFGSQQNLAGKTKTSDKPAPKDWLEPKIYTGSQETPKS